jgi:hypothetical protein
VGLKYHAESLTDTERKTVRAMPSEMFDNLIPPAPKVEAPKGWRPAIELDGDEGFAITPGMPADEKPNFDEFLIDAGFDPAEIEIVGTPRTSRWQRYDGSWLTSYRFQFRKHAANIDLPTLFQEAKKTKAPTPRVISSDKALVVMVADLQVGKQDHRGGTKELISRALETFARVEAQVKSGKYEQVILADMGDVVENFGNAANEQQTFTNDLSLMQQVDLATTLIWDLLKRVSKYCANVTYATIASNHCQFRINKQQVGRPGLDDWGVVIAQQIARLSREVGLPVRVLVPEPHDESLALDVFGDGFHVLGLWHGHQANRPEAVPDWWRKQAFGNSPVAGATIGLTAHFHHLRVQELGQAPNGGSRWWIQAPTLDNGSNWWRLTAGEDSTPGLAVFELERGKHYSGTVFKL